MDDQATQTLISEKILPGIRLSVDLKIGEAWKNCMDFRKWKTRLNAVQEQKKDSLYLVIGDDGEVSTYDTQSELSMTSKGSSKFSVVTGASMVKGNKKQKKPKNLAKRNVKEGSIFEEDWLVDKLNELKIDEEEVINLGHLIDTLIIFSESEKACELITQYRELEQLIKRRSNTKTDWVKTLGQEEFENTYPEIADLYTHIDEFQRHEQLEIKKKKGKEEPKVFHKYEFLLT